MKIKLKRIEMGIKQLELAEMLGITPQYLRKIEAGKVDLKLSLALKISEILGIQPKDLF